MKINAKQAERILKRIQDAGIDCVYNVFHSDHGGAACISMDGYFQPHELKKIYEIVEQETKY